MRFAFPVLLALAGSCGVADAQPLDWIRYRLPESTVSVDLPSRIFTVDAGATKAGTGRSFRTSDGRADVSLYSTPNSPGRSPSEFLRETFQLSPSSAIYRRVTDRMLAVSGYRGETIWYARCNFAFSRVNCVAMNYPRAEKREWDAVVTRISNSLSSSGG